MKEVKPKKCKACKKPFTPFNSLQVVCGPSCAALLVKHAPEEANKAVRAMDRKWVKDTRQKHKENDHGYHEKLLETEINTIVRLIEKDQLCISHGKPPLKRNAGHYHSVGANNSIRFHLENIWLQCESCNGPKGSNRSGYDKGLVDTFGQEYFLRINQDIVRMYPLVKLSIIELQDAIKIARQIVKELTKLDMVYSNEMRVRLRKEYNKRIGIYLIE